MKKTCVLLIVPPYVPIEEFRTNNPRKYSVSNISMPLGPLSIASYIRKYSNVAVDILDFNVALVKYTEVATSLNRKDFIFEQFTKLRSKKYYDIVGISALFSSNWGYLRPISEMSKDIWPEVIVVTGGGFPTNMYSYVLNNVPTIDGVAIGEAEKPFLGLVKADNKMQYLNSTSSWMTREKLKLHLVPTHDVITNLDEIPFLSYDLIDFKEYQKLSPYHGERKSDIIAAHIVTSRGCPYKCSFCSSHTIHGRKIRYHSIERVLADIYKLKEIYGINTLLFQDDAFHFDKKRAIKILEGISTQNLIIEFPNGLSIEDLDGEVIEALKKAGLRIATLAVESGCERVLNQIIHKPYKKLSKVKDVVFKLRKENIYVRGFFMIGFPDESMEEIQESVNFMKEVGFNWVALFIASPIVGSKLYEVCKKNNLLLSDSLEHFHFGLCNIKLPHSTPQELERLKYLINLEVNFIDNYDLRNNRFDIALIGFKDVINRVPNHAFAHYFASICYRSIGNKHLERTHFEKYSEIINDSKEWAEYANRYNLVFNPSFVTEREISRRGNCRE